MIYQHRLVISRGGRLSKRHEVFQGDSMKVIESHGSVLVGAWEVWIGAEAGSSVYQIRQFDSLADWEQHQQRMRDDAAHDLAGAAAQRIGGRHAGDIGERPHERR